MVPGWGKIGGQNRLDLRAFDSGYTRCNSAVFWQTERLLSIFSTGKEKNSFTGFSGIGPGTGNGNGARIGLISFRADYESSGQPSVGQYSRYINHDNLETST